MTNARRARIEFFAHHAGYATPPGRMACAKQLADAEEWAEVNGIEAQWEVDEYADLSCFDEEMLARIEDGTYEVLWCLVEHGERVASLSGIVVAWGDPYIRVVEAELFAELIL